MNIIMASVISKQKQIRKLLTILIILAAFLILGISLNVQQHTNQSDAEPTHEERVEVVGGGEVKESNEEIVEDLHDGIIQSTTSNKDSEETYTLEESKEETNDTPSNELLWESGNNESIQESEITNYIKEIWGDNADFGINLAMCESSLNPSAVSPSGKYVGLYQYSQLTFDTNCTGDISDWKAQVRCTKTLIDNGEYFRWPACTEKLK